MKLEQLIHSVQGLKTQNNLQLYALIGMSVLTLVLGLAVVNKDTVVTVIPPNLNVEAEIGYDWASTSYKEAWALYLSLSLGNVTPTNASFVKNAIDPVLGPGIYQHTMKALEKQIDKIKSNHITLYFEPRRVLREEESGKIFVHGQSVLETPTGQRERTEKTYEFVISVLNYMPSLTYVDTYPGPPRTTDELDRLKRMEQNSQRRGNG